MKVWLNGLIEKWKAYRIRRAIKIVEQEGEYSALRRRIAQLEIIAGVREEDSRRALGNCFGLEKKIEEERARVSQLERDFSEVGVKLEESKIDYQRLEREYAELAQRSGILEDNNKSTFRNLNSAKNLAKNFHRSLEELRERLRELENERNGFERRKTAELEGLFRVREQEIVLEYRKGLENLAESCNALFKEVLAGTKDSNLVRIQLYSSILCFYEKNSSFGRSSCVFLDHNLIPVYATPGFYRFFEISPEVELAEFPFKEDILAQSKDKPNNIAGKSFSVDWKGNGNRKPCKIDLNIRYLSNKSGDSIGAVVEYDEHQGTLSRIFTLGARKPAVGDI